MRIAYPGRTLLARGIDVDDPDAYYLFETDMAILWPIDPENGLFMAEDSYTGDDGMEGIASRKLSEGDIRLYQPQAA